MYFFSAASPQAGYDSAVPDYLVIQTHRYVNFSCPIRAGVLEMAYSISWRQEYPEFIVLDNMTFDLEIHVDEDSPVVRYQCIVNILHNDVVDAEATYHGPLMTARGIYIQYP